MEQEIKIDIVEVAGELADDMVRNPFRTAGYSESEIDDRILINNGSYLSLKEEYQDEFNTWYNMFYSKIESLKLNE
jgi:hypothetical protein